MKERKPYNPFSRKNAVIISILISVLLHIILTTTSYLNYSTNKPALHSIDRLYDILISIAGNAIMLYVLFRCSFRIIQKNWKPTKKYLLLIITQFILAITLSLISSRIYSLLLSEIMTSHVNFIYKNLMIDIIYAIIVLLTTISISEIVKNQELAIENFQNRQEALKNQLDPHFLFNSLNVLDGLIAPDNEKAHDYIQNLSLTFRRTIQNKKIAELSEELDLVEAYVYLLRIRYDKNLKIEYNINNKYHTYLLPHISLQLLVENAIKHNIVNDRNPLSILIETTAENTVKVTNNRNPKTEKAAGCGIGLNNLKERYKLEFNQEITIHDCVEFFSVELPLIEQIKA